MDFYLQHSALLPILIKYSFLNYYSIIIPKISGQRKGKNGKVLLKIEQKIATQFMKMLNIHCIKNTRHLTIEQEAK